MLDKVGIIIRKEIKDALRDPSSLFAAALYTLITPIMLWVALMAMTTEAAKIVNKEIKLNGLDQGSVITSHLSDNGFTFSEDAQVNVTIVGTTSEGFSTNKPVSIIINGDLTKTADTVNAVEEALLSLSTIIIDQRFKVLDIPSNFIEPLDVQIENSNETSYQTRTIIYILVICFLMPLAFTAMSLSIDMTAGERERLTLEPLLAQPVSTLSIMIGKCVTSFLLTMVGSAFAITISSLMISYVPIAGNEIDISFGLISAVKIFMYLTPACAVFSALQLAVALYAKSYKEGMTLAGILGLIPLSVSFLSDDTIMKYDFLPLFWEVGAIKTTLLADSTSLVIPSVSLLISCLIVIACLFYTQRRLKLETLLN